MNGVDSEGKPELPIVTQASTQSWLPCIRDTAAVCYRDIVSI